MADIRGGRFSRPHRETRSTAASRVPLAEPPGSELKIEEDGSLLITDVADEKAPIRRHLDNLAEDLTPERLREIAQDYLDAIDIDIEAHRAADKNYEEALRRTGLGNDAPGGAPFNGASRAVHPMLTEAVVDYAARVTKELLPPEGPVKAQIIGKPTNDKSSRAERVARYMNWQLVHQMQSFINEIEIGLPQEALAGAFYTKMVVVDGAPSVEVVFADQVHRPWGDGDFYTQPRITHEMRVDKHMFRDNVESGLWLDVLDPRTSGDLMEDSSPAKVANDRIIGQNQPIQNVDEVRTVYEISTRMVLDPDSSNEEDRRVLPYLLTIDEQTQQVLSIYRNWKEGDPNYFRLDFLIEWPFIPWRGGYPIGFGRMIGSLSGAASGALRALLDAALLNSMQTGVKLKGGTTVGGQNIRPQPGSTTEVQGSLAQDPDIRKTYMPLEFPQPSPVLFELLGFLVDAGKSVVRTTFDEFNKMNGEMPVGTANMMIEQGLTTYGSIYGRQHRALLRFLKQLWYINQHTVDNAQIQDDFGELLVTKEDFEGPMTVVPVSDPRIFTDAQRLAQAQMVASRAQAYITAGVPLYKSRAAELYLLRQAKVPDPEQFLTDAPEPVQMVASSENVAASHGLPIKAYPGQDHEAHIAQHAAYIQSPIFGSNPVLAQKALPLLINHMGDHLALWYDAAMKSAVDEILRKKFKDERITTEALATIGELEVQLDRVMAMVTPAVMRHAQEELAPVLQILQNAQQLMKSLQPPTPMDPSIVAMKDVERQEKKDQADAANKTKEIELKAIDVTSKVQTTQQQAQTKTQLDVAKLSQDDQHHQQNLAQEQLSDDRDFALRLAELKQADQDRDADVEVQLDANRTQREIAEKANSVQLQVSADSNNSKVAVANLQGENQRAIAADGNQTKRELADKQVETQKAIAKDANKNKLDVAKAKPKPKPSGKRP